MDATIPELQAAQAAFLRNGIRPDELRALVMAVVGGASFAAAAAAVVAKALPPVDPAVVAGYEAPVAALAAISPPYYT